MEEIPSWREKALEDAISFKDHEPDRAEGMLLEVLVGEQTNFGGEMRKVDEEDERKVRAQEAAVAALLEIYVKMGNVSGIVKLLDLLKLRFFPRVAKAKTAKLVRTLIDAVDRIPGTKDSGVLQGLCEETIEWCKSEKRTFLRQKIEGRLAALHLESKRFLEAMTILDELLREVKRLDDKAHLLEIQLLESKVYRALRNLPKSKAALTSARTTANAIYVPPAFQGEIDMQAGIVAADEKDYKTAYSYFYEAFEGFMSLDDPRAAQNLKYMQLCKIMANSSPGDVISVVSGSVALKYAGPDLEAMQSIAKAYEARSLQDFELVLEKYRSQLGDDPVVETHLSSLYNGLLENNLLRIIEPFSRVEIEHVASLIKLNLSTVESKLSQMILDKKLNGILDQGNGILVVYETRTLPKAYQSTIDTFSKMDLVVDSLFERALSLK
uniref:PCI domain-containing protein n=1 Tax=Compsopogon caeruleus TaxID=31354 RepID=A0A7S1T5K1_9RHOD